MFSTSIIYLILPFIVSLPLFSCLILFFVPNKNVLLAKQIALFTSFLVFFVSLFLWLFFDKEYARFQFVYDLAWIPS
jgi:NADH-quinone oxidoreductase subunit M